MMCAFANMCDIANLLKNTKTFQSSRMHPRCIPAELLARHLYDLEKCRHETFLLK